jgi:hypothetical protein
MNSTVGFCIELEALRTEIDPNSSWLQNIEDCLNIIKDRVGSVNEKAGAHCIPMV